MPCPFVCTRRFTSRLFPYQDDLAQHCMGLFQLPAQRQPISATNRAGFTSFAGGGASSAQGGVREVRLVFHLSPVANGVHVQTVDLCHLDTCRAPAFAVTAHPTVALAVA